MFCNQRDIPINRNLNGLKFRHYSSPNYGKQNVLNFDILSILFASGSILRICTCIFVILSIN